MSGKHCGLRSTGIAAMNSFTQGMSSKQTFISKDSQDLYDHGPRYPGSLVVERIKQIWREHAKAKARPRSAVLTKMEQYVIAYEGIVMLSIVAYAMLSVSANSFLTGRAAEFDRRRQLVEQYEMQCHSSKLRLANLQSSTEFWQQVKEQSQERSQKWALQHQIDELKHKLALQDNHKAGTHTPNSIQATENSPGAGKTWFQTWKQRLKQWRVFATAPSSQTNQQDTRECMQQPSPPQSEQVQQGSPVDPSEWQADRMHDRLLTHSRDCAQHWQQLASMCENQARSLREQGEAEVRSLYEAESRHIQWQQYTGRDLDLELEVPLSQDLISRPLTWAQNLVNSWVSLDVSQGSSDETDANLGSSTHCKDGSGNAQQQGCLEGVGAQNNKPTRHVTPRLTIRWWGSQWNALEGDERLADLLSAWDALFGSLEKEQGSDTPASIEQCPRFVQQ